MPGTASLRDQSDQCDATTQQDYKYYCGAVTPPGPPRSWRGSTCRNEFRRRCIIRAEGSHTSYTVRNMQQLSEVENTQLGVAAGVIEVTCMQSVNYLKNASQQ